MARKRNVSWYLELPIFQDTNTPEYKAYLQAKKDYIASINEYEYTERYTVADNAELNKRAINKYIIMIERRRNW